MLKKIALFLPNLGGGGAERVMLFLAQKLLSEGLEVHLILARAEGELLPLIPKDACVFFLCKNKKTFLNNIIFPLEALLRLIIYLNCNKPSALLSTLTGANLIAVISNQFAFPKTRLVLREAASLQNVKNPFRILLIKMLYPRANAIVALTSYMQTQLINDIGLPAKLVTCIPNPIDQEKLKMQSQQPLGHPWFSKNTVPVILGIGRLTPQKNFELLVRAFAIARKKCHIRLVILGEGPEREKLETLIEELKLQADILLPGYDPNPYRWLKHSKLFALSSRWEGQPNAVLEAICLGKPVVINMYDPSTIYFSKYTNVILVEAGNIEAMAIAILAGIESDEVHNLELEDHESTSKYLSLLLDGKQ